MTLSATSVGLIRAATVRERTGRRRARRAFDPDRRVACLAQGGHASSTANMPPGEGHVRPLAGHAIQRHLFRDAPRDKTASWRPLPGGRRFARLPVDFVPGVGNGGNRLRRNRKGFLMFDMIIAAVMVFGFIYAITLTGLVRTA